MSDLTAIDILVNPDEATIQRAPEVNARMLQSMPEGWALDDTHQPHITTLQRYVRTARRPLGVSLASGTIEGEIDGLRSSPAVLPVEPFNRDAARLGRRGRAGRGLPGPEPGAGSAGPGAAQRRRLTYQRLNSAACRQVSADFRTATSASTVSD